jgi:pteridine reductase
MANNRVALVTGGAKRVGRAVVERLAAAGFDICFTFHHSEGEAAQTVAAIERIGRRARAIPADLTRPADATTLIGETVEREFDRLDVLVNNASLYEVDAPPAGRTEQVQRLFAIHFESPLRLCERLGPLLRKTGGHVVNMLDVTFERPWPEYATYCASKAALWNLTLSFAQKLAPQVTVNGIAPSVVEWPDHGNEDYRRRYLSRIPLKRAGRPEDVAEAILYLCTAGSYITGQVLRLDGGYSIT